MPTRVGDDFIKSSPGRCRCRRRSIRATRRLQLVCRASGRSRRRPARVPNHSPPVAHAVTENATTAVLMDRFDHICLRRFDERDHLHLPTALETRQGVDFIDSLDQHRPGFADSMQCGFFMGWSAADRLLSRLRTNRHWLETVRCEPTPCKATFADATQSKGLRFKDRNCVLPSCFDQFDQCRVSSRDSVFLLEFVFGLRYLSPRRVMDSLSKLTMQ